MTYEKCISCGSKTEVLPVDYFGRDYICQECKTALVKARGQSYLADYVETYKLDFLLKYFKLGKLQPPYDLPWWEAVLEKALISYNGKCPGALNNLMEDFAKTCAQDFQDYVIKRESEYI